MTASMYYIGEKIRLARLERGWNQKQLGAYCQPKISQQRISVVEKHETDTEKKIVKKIAQGLGKTIKDIESYGCVQYNDQQSGGEAANIIVHDASDTLEEMFRAFLEQSKQDKLLLFKAIEQVEKKNRNTTKCLTSIPTRSLFLAKAGGYRLIDE